MSILALLLAGAAAAPALAKLPPLSDEAKAKAAAAAAKSAWAGKVGGYKLCQAMDRVAQSYRSSGAAASGATAAASSAAPVATPPCADPGPFVATASEPKPLEASGAHSPPEMAKGAPSSKATSAEITGPRK
ncbi:MAG: hypothetical protein ABI641_07015 [Caldimonas sp.]